MIKTKEATISGKQFKVTQLGYADGIELLTKLLSMAGQSFEEAEKKESFSLGKLATNLKPYDLKKVMSTLAKRPVIEREPGSDKWPTLEPVLGKIELFFVIKAFPFT